MPWLRIALWIGGGYLALCLLLWAVQDRLIFHPRPLAAQPTNRAATPIEIVRDAATLRGWIVNDAHAAGPLIVYFGGNAEEVSGSIGDFARRAATTVLVNYRSYGESTGKASQQALLDDAVAVVDWARRRHPNRPLALFGNSLGSGVAALAAPRVAADGVILVSPYRSIAHVARRYYPIFPIRWLLRHPFDAEAAAAELPPAFIAASPMDRVIPFEESRAMARAIGAPAFETFDVAHGGFPALPSFWAAVDGFLATLGQDVPRRLVPSPTSLLPFGQDSPKA